MRLCHHYLYHVDQSELCGNASITKHLHPVPLTSWGGREGERERERSDLLLSRI